MLEQEVALKGEAAVLIIQLSQEVVEPNRGQRVLHRHGFPDDTGRFLYHVKAERTNMNNVCWQQSYQSTLSIHLLRY